MVLFENVRYSIFEATIALSFCCTSADLYCTVLLAEISILPVMCVIAHKQYMDPLIKLNSTAALVAKTSSVYLNKMSKEMHRAYIILHCINNNRKVEP